MTIAEQNPASTAILSETMISFWHADSLRGGPTKKLLESYRKHGRVSRLNGQRVFLQWVRAPGGIHTSFQAWERFLSAWNGDQSASSSIQER